MKGMNKKRIKTFWTLFYPAERLLRIFCWRHVPHQRCHQQAKNSTLGCWASRWLQPDGYEHSRCYDIMCCVKDGVISSGYFELENLTGESSRNMITHHASLRFRLLGEDFIYYGGWGLLEQFSSRYNTFGQHASNQLDWKGCNICLAGTLSRPDRLQFLFVWSYRLKDTFCNIGSIEEMRRLIRPEICQISQDTLDNVWDITNLWLNYVMKVYGVHIEKLRISKITLCYSFVFCKRLSKNFQKLSKIFLYFSRVFGAPSTYLCVTWNIYCRKCPFSIGKGRRLFALGKCWQPFWCETFVHIIISMYEKFCVTFWNVFIILSHFSLSPGSNNHD